VNLPILMAHDSARPIGRIFVHEGQTIVELMPEHAITTRQFSETFGNFGAQFLETQYREGAEFVLRARLLEVSVDPVAR
jgi:hypothetical protein